jgi:flagella synthesis protein FlgN
MAMTAEQQLFTTLQSELKIARALDDCLQAERASLTDTDVEAIDEMTRKKQPLIVQLEQLGRQRESLLKSTGFPAGKAGLEAFVANLPAAQSAVFNELMQQLREVARRCRMDNQINGGIVNVNRQYMLRALSVLRGRDQQPESYGPGGEYSSQVVRQPLIGRV